MVEVIANNSSQIISAHTAQAMANAYAFDANKENINIFNMASETIGALGNSRKMLNECARRMVDETADQTNFRAKTNKKVDVDDAELDALIHARNARKEKTANKTKDFMRSWLL